MFFTVGFIYFVLHCVATGRVLWGTIADSERAILHRVRCCGAVLLFSVLLYNRSTVNAALFEASESVGHGKSSEPVPAQSWNC